jgi:hypothetical protein
MYVQLPSAAHPGTVRQSGGVAGAGGAGAGWADGGDLGSVCGDALATATPSPVDANAGAGLAAPVGAVPHPRQAQARTHETSQLRMTLIVATRASGCRKTTAAHAMPFPPATCSSVQPQVHFSESTVSPPDSQRSTRRCDLPAVAWPEGSRFGDSRANRDMGQTNRLWGGWRGGACAVVAGLVAALAGTRSVQAQDLKTVPGLKERVAHEKSVVGKMLEADQCSGACLSLEAMRQGVDRLCKLDPDPGRVARRDLQATSDRVAAQCVGCFEVADIDKGSPGHDSGACIGPGQPVAKVRQGGCASCAIGTPIDPLPRGAAWAFASLAGC